MNWVLNPEQPGRNSFSINLVHRGFVPNQDLAFFSAVAGKVVCSDLEPQELPLPMHQDRFCRFRLSRNSLQRLSRSNYTRIEPEPLRYAIAPISQLFQALLLFGGRPDPNGPNAFRPFRFGQPHCLLQGNMQALEP